MLLLTLQLVPDLPRLWSDTCSPTHTGCLRRSSFSDSISPRTQFSRHVDTASSCKGVTNCVFVLPTPHAPWRICTSQNCDEFGSVSQRKSTSMDQPSRPIATKQHTSKYGRNRDAFRTVCSQILPECCHFANKGAGPESELLRQKGDTTWSKKGTSSEALRHTPNQLVPPSGPRRKFTQDMHSHHFSAGGAGSETLWCGGLSTRSRQEWCFLASFTRSI